MRSHFAVTLQNERQMPSHLTHHPVTRDSIHSIRYPDTRELLDFNLAKHLHYSKLEATTLEDLDQVADTT